MKDIFLKLMFIIEVPEFHNNLPFFPEIMKVRKVENLEANLHDKT